MAKRASKAKASRRPARKAPDSVEAFMAGLEHPLKPAIEALRALVLGVDPSVSEGIKWNGPSFRTSEWFATLNLRGRGGEERVWLVLHLGAKKRAPGAAEPAIDDPGELLEWLAPDRALVTFDDAADVRRKQKALRAVLSQWIALLPA